MDDHDIEPEETINLLGVAWLVGWTVIPAGLVTILTKALIAEFPSVEVTWLFIAAATPVAALAWVFAIWIRNRNA